VRGRINLVRFGGCGSGWWPLEFGEPCRDGVRAFRISPAAAQREHLRECLPRVHLQLELQRDLGKLAQRAVALRVELQHLSVECRGARVESLLEVVVGELEKTRRGGLPLTGAFTQVGQLLDDVPVGWRLLGEALVDPDGQVGAALSLVPVGLADEVVAGGEGVVLRYGSSS